MAYQQTGNSTFGTVGGTGIGSAIGGTAGTFLGGPLGTMAGSAIGGAAEALVGSLLGGGSSKTPEYDYAGAKKAQKDSINAHWKFTMKQAKKHGIHPLVALGVNPAQGNPVYTSVDREVGSSMGQNLGRAANAAVQNAFRDKELDALAKERAHLENDLLRAQISEINLQAGDPRSGVITQPEKLMTEYEYKGEKIPVALDEMGEGSQFWVDMTVILPKIIKAQGKAAATDWAIKNKDLFIKKSGDDKAFVKILRNIRAWALKNQR